LTIECVKCYAFLIYELKVLPFDVFSAFDLTTLKEATSVASRALIRP
jgi:hypothetical protein